MGVVVCVEEGEGGATEGFAEELSGAAGELTGEGEFCAGEEEGDAGGIGLMGVLSIVIDNYIILRSWRGGTRWWRRRW